MVCESLYVGAYWAARPEPLGVCARRSTDFFGRLAAVHPLFRSWFLKGARRSEARTVFATDLESVGRALASGRNRRDADDSVIERLGFSLGVWNGDDADPVSLSIACGITSSRVVNAVVLDIPRRSERSAELYDRASAVRIMGALVDTWDPDWGTMTTRGLRQAQASVAGAPVLGWLTYLSTHRGDVPALPPPFSVERVAGKGSIILLNDYEMLDTSALAALSEALGPDLLRPSA